MYIEPYKLTDEWKYGNKIQKSIAVFLSAGILYASIPSNLDELNKGIKLGAASGLVYGGLEGFIFLGLKSIAKYYDTNGHRLIEHSDDADQNFIDFFIKDLFDSEFPFIDVNFIGPLEEELINRGLMLPLIKMGLLTATVPSFYASTIAIVISAFIFAIQHDPDRTMQASTFFCGIMYGTLKETNSIWSSVTSHMMFNLIIGVIGAVYDYVEYKLRIFQELQPIEDYKSASMESPSSNVTNINITKYVTNGVFNMFSTGKCVDTKTENTYNSVNDEEDEVRMLSYLSI